MSNVTPEKMLCHIFRKSKFNRYERSLRHQDAAFKSGGVIILQEHKPHLFIKVYQSLIWQLEGLDGLQDCVPVAAVYVRHEALYTVHSVQGHGGLLLQGGQSPVQVIFLQVLHDQTDHAVGKHGLLTSL